MLRKITIGVCAFVLAISILTGIASFALVRTLGDPDYLKQTLRESAVYEAVSGQLSIESADISPKDQARINKALAAATTNKSIQQIGDQTIDQVFSFLQGNTKVEDISIDITPITSKLDKELVRQVEEEIDANIKDCKKLQQNGVAVNCVELQSQRADADKLVDEAFGEDGVLADGNLTLADIQELGAEQNSGAPSQPQPDAEQTLRALAAAYQLARLGVIVCGVLTLLSIAGIILCSRDKLRGVRRVSVIALVNGAIVVITAVIGSFIASKGNATFVNPGDNLADAFGLAGSSIVEDFARYNQNLGLILVALSTIGLIVSWVLIRRRPEQTPTNPPTTPETIANKLPEVPKLSSK